MNIEKLIFLTFKYMIIYWQIWLNLLMDDHNLGYITKLNLKKKNTAT
jgi:hypothetical protein